MKKLLWVLFLSCTSALFSCGYFSSKKGTSAFTYTCPMPEDSVFSDKPGKCPKCGMQLVLVSEEEHSHAGNKDTYTCPMPEDSVFSDKPGTCPKCGMDLMKVEAEGKQMGEITLDALLKPSNQFVVSNIPVTAISMQEFPVEWEAFGSVEYDTRSVGTISSRVAGRIEKLYVRHRYQKVQKGQKLLDVYSPELLTAQQDLLFLLKNDPDNISFIQSAKEKLMLLGMSNDQVQGVIRSGKAMMTITVFSPYSGHVHEAGGMVQTMPSNTGGMAAPATLTTQELPIKEGMYLQRGQGIFSIYNPAKAWALLNVYGENLTLVKTGQRVRVVPESAPGKDFRASVNFIEPFYRKNSKALTVRVYFDNSHLQLPIGSQVKASIFGDYFNGQWLPQESVLSLGLDKVVFVRAEGGFKARKVIAGRMYGKWIEINSGLTTADSVAANAQYLMDSESFVKVKDQ